MKLDQFTKTISPLSCIVNFVNPVGIKLAEMLLEQGSRVILIDTFTPAKKKVIADLLKNEKCIFMDIDSTFKNLEKFKKIDYIYYFLSSQVAGSDYPEAKADELELWNITHKDFTKETSRVDAYIKLAIEFDAKFELITSGFLGQLIEMPSEQNIQLQKYCESLLLDYYNKTRFNGRIVRIAEVYGERLDVTVPTNFSRLVREVMFKEAVNIYGEGLQNNYFVHYLDAVYGLLKLNFTEKTKGKIYLLADHNPISTLSLAYRLLEMTPDEKEVIFNDVNASNEGIVRLKDMSIAPGAQEIGWEPTMTFEASLQETIKALSVQFGREWKTPRMNMPVAVKKETYVDSETPEKGKKLKDLGKVKKEIVWYRFDYMLYSLFKNLVQKPFEAMSKAPSNVTKSIAAATPRVRFNIIPAFVTFSVVLVIAILLAPYISLGVYGTRAYFLLKDIKRNTGTFNAVELKRNTEELPKTTHGMKTAWEGVSYLRYVGGNTTKFYDTTTILLEAVDYYAKSGEEVVKGALPLIAYAKEFKVGEINNTSGQGSADFFTQITEMKDGSPSVYKGAQYAGIAKDLLSKADFSVYPDFLKQPVNELKSFSNDYTVGLQTIAEVYDFIPYMLGYRQRTNYLLMVQNETEIRATGGWFTNYAILGIENGKVRELTVDDVYNIDGQVSAKVAPQDMQDGLDLAGYRFSLSNWSPDISKTGAEAESFLKEAGKTSQINVYVTMNFSFIRDLLKVTGPINAGGEYGDVTAENLFDKVVQLHTNFTPGSQQKVGLVSSVVPKLVERISTLDTDGKQKVLETLATSIMQRQLMIYSTSAAFNDQFLLKHNTYKPLTNNESLIFPVDWNWSGNKTNKYVKRELAVEINEGAKEVRFAATYRNTSQTDNYPEGKYRNFQRVYVPDTWIFKEATGYLQPMKQYRENDNLQYTGQMIEIPIQATRTFGLKYGYLTLPEQFTVVKQSGIESEPVTISITKSSNSTINEDLLMQQGFSQNGNIWSKSFLRLEDVSVQLR